MSITELIGGAKQVYDVGGVGCCLHIVLDDGNLNDGDVDFCIRRAEDHGHETCKKFAVRLRAESLEVREQLYERYDEYYTGTESLIQKLWRSK